jgi:hypothetical protein
MDAAYGWVGVLFPEAWHSQHMSWLVSHFVHPSRRSASRSSFTISAFKATGSSSTLKTA